MTRSPALLSEGLLSDLNGQQRQAVLHVEGPLLVLAGPGSGKTRVITRRVAYRACVVRIPLERILGITFTNRAAEEMKSRIGQLLGEAIQPRLGTFHWVGSAILRRHAHRIGIRRDFRLLSASEARRALFATLEAGEQFRGLRMSAAADAISAVKNGASMAAVQRTFTIPEALLRSLLAQYGRTLREAGALDLDDLLHLSVALLEADPNVRELCRAAYDEILVDEFQDVNPVQQALLRLLLPHNGTIIAVGDEDQAIYRWRQADASAILDFSTNFPRGSVIKLEQTYRSSQRILRSASTLIEHNRERLGKRLRTNQPLGVKPLCFVANDEVEEADWIAEEIVRLAEREGRSWTDFAVMYRINAQSRALEGALLRAGVPYHVQSGHRFYDRPEVRRCLAYLRVALDRRDNDALLQLAADLPGIGPRRLEILRASADPNRSLVDPLVDRLPDVPLPTPVSAALHRLVSSIESVFSKREASLSEVVAAAVEATTGDLDLLPSVDYDSALENLNELRWTVRELGARRGTLREFVDRIAMQSGERMTSQGVSCMSLHAAKGTEFPVVFIAGVEEGLLPHHRSFEQERAIEEERRLCYVGVTRAKERLSLSYARTRLLAGQALIGHASRFVGEMGADNVKLSISPAVASRPRLQSVSLGQRVMHARWKAGTVVLVEGKGKDTLVTVDFDRVGTQRLQLCHAPLTLLPAEQVHVLS